MAADHPAGPLPMITMFSTAKAIPFVSLSVRVPVKSHRGNPKALKRFQSSSRARLVPPVAGLSEAGEPSRPAVPPPGDTAGLPSSEPSRFHPPRPDERRVYNAPAIEVHAPGTTNQVRKTTSPRRTESRSHKSRFGGTPRHVRVALAAAFKTRATETPAQPDRHRHERGNGPHDAGADRAGHEPDIDPKLLDAGIDAAR